MLDGRIATTHWQYCEQLGEQYPAINVRHNVLYVQQDNIWTSAGASAGTDACLSITRQLLGDAIAESVSKQMAVTLERSGSHIQIADATSSSQHRFDSDLDTYACCSSRIRSIHGKQATSPRHWECP